MVGSPSSEATDRHRASRTLRPRELNANGSPAVAVLDPLKVTITNYPA
jgi:hypothetical protein